MEEKTAIPVAKEAVKYLPFYYYELTPELKKKAEEELFEDDDHTRQVLNQFKNLIEENEGYSNILRKDEDFIPFLRGGKYNLKRVYTIYLNHISIFKKHDKLFKNYEFSSCLKPIESNTVCFLPRRDADGCAVFVCLLQKKFEIENNARPVPDLILSQVQKKCKGKGEFTHRFDRKVFDRTPWICRCEEKYWDVSEFNVMDITRAALTGFLDCSRCPITQISGIKFIIDYAGLTLKRIIHVHPWIFKFAVDALQSALPLRMKEYHVINNGTFFTYVWAIMGPLMSKKLRKRVHFHGFDHNSLHKFISPSILPAELGGELGPQDNSEWLRAFVECKEYVTTYIQRARKE